MEDNQAVYMDVLQDISDTVHARQSGDMVIQESLQEIQKILQDSQESNQESLDQEYQTITLQLLDDISKIQQVNTVISFAQIGVMLSIVFAIFWRHRT